MRGLRVVILACAAFSAMLAMWFMRSALESRAAAPAPVAQVVADEPVEQAPQTVEVLVAAQDVAIGRSLTPEDIRWQKWPADSTSPYFYVREEDPEAAENLEGAAARLAIRAGEPLTSEKIVDLEGAGIMASLLRNGMRAISVPISDVTGAGGFILPGDFVDLLLTRQIDIEEINAETGEVERTSTHNQTDTIMETVRVVAIDQRLNEQGEISAVGNTATLEVTAEQAELITLTRQIAKQERGFLTLSLRSFSEMVEIYGDELSDVLPVTKLDLRELARLDLERAAEMRKLYEQSRKSREREADLARLRAAEEERLRIQLESDAAAAAAAPPVTTVETVEEETEESGVVLVRNGQPIVVNTINRRSAEEAGK